MDFYKGNIPIIDTEGPATDLSHPAGMEFGYVERDYRESPQSMFSPPSEMELIPASEWDARYDEQEATKSSLEHIYLSRPNGEPAFDALDQNGDGYCWSYSTFVSIMLDRLRRGLPVPRLNPHGPAAIIKRGRNEGGWCGLSAQFGTEFGCPVEGTGPGQWPLHSRNLKHDTPECRAEMLKHRISEDFVDMTRQVYDRNLTEAQVATCGFNNIPGPRDYNHWGHSVCGVRWVRVERGSWGQLILNSWKKSWGRFGLAVLVGSKRICNGGLAVRLTSN